MEEYTLLDPVRASNGSRDAEEVLKQPTAVLIGVSEQAAAVLAQIDISTVLDLATSELFSHARNITLLAEDGEGTFSLVGRVQRDAIRDGSGMSLAELVAAPISRLASRFPVEKLDELAAALDLGSIHDMAAWPPYRAACDLLNRVYNPTPSYEVGELDAGTPLDLLPATGQYPTERVQYEVLLFAAVDQAILGPRPRPAPRGGPPAGPIAPARGQAIVDEPQRFVRVVPAPRVSTRGVQLSPASWPAPRSAGISTAHRRCTCSHRRSTRWGSGERRVSRPGRSSAQSA